MDADDDDKASERAELHFLAALVDELMRKLHTTGVLDKDGLSEIEAEVARRIGTVPRAW